MIIRILLFITQLFICFSLFGQISIIDSTSNTPIPAVNIFDNHGNLLFISDNNGLIDQNKLKKVSLNDTLLFQHISFINKHVTLQDILLERKIKLIPRIAIIEEIIVNNKPKDWLVLRGYFRSLQRFDGNYKSFADGIVSYYIQLNVKRPKVKHLTEDYRIFTNEKVIEEFKSAMGPFSEPPEIPRIKQQPLHLNLPYKYYFKNEGEALSFFFQETKIGEMKTIRDGKIQSSIDFVRPNTEVKWKFFRIEAIIKSQVQIETYNSNNLNEASIANLESFYRNNIGSIKRKKRLGHIPFETLTNFFVIERSFLSNDEVAKIGKSFDKSSFLEGKSRYDNNFWLEIENFNIPPLPKGISKQLKQY